MDAFLPSLALALPLLTAGPASGPPAPLAAPGMAAEPAPDPQLARRSGLHMEVGVGGAVASVPGDTSWLEFVGFNLRAEFSFTFLIGKRLRLGPVLAENMSYAQATAEDGSKASIGYLGITPGVELEWELARDASLFASVGPTLTIAPQNYLGPELSLGITQHFPASKNGRRNGLSYRATFAPLFALDVPNADPGYMAQFTIGMTGGMP